MGPRCTWLFLLYLICVIGSIKVFSRCRGYWSILLSICRVCIYMFGWLCRATYCSVVSTSMLGVSHAVQNEKKLQKFTWSDIAYTKYTCSAGYAELTIVLLYLLRCLVYHMCKAGRRHRVSPCRSAYFASPWRLLTLNLRRRSREAAIFSQSRDAIKLILSYVF